VDLIGRNVVRPIAPEDVDALQALEAAADTLLWGGRPTWPAGGVERSWWRNSSRNR